MAHSCQDFFLLTIIYFLSKVFSKNYLEQYYIIYPTLSKTRNLGFDGTGNTCQTFENDFFSSQLIDGESSFYVKEDTLNDAAFNKKCINAIDSRNFFQIAKAYVKIYIYKAIGIKSYKKIWMMLKSKKYNDFLE